MIHVVPRSGLKFVINRFTQGLAALSPGLRTYRPAKRDSIRNTDILCLPESRSDDRCEAGDLEMVLRSGRVTSPRKDLASPL
jgi:hypothetical protein